LEIQYVTTRHRDGLGLITLQQAQVKEANEPQKRIPENPIQVARKYLRERENGTAKTYEQIAKAFGVSRVEVCYHISLVNRLPEEFVSWLEGCEDPEVLRVFTERRLRPIARIEEREEQWNRIVEALQNSEARIFHTTLLTCTNRLVY